MTPSDEVRYAVATRQRAHYERAIDDPDSLDSWRQHDRINLALVNAAIWRMHEERHDPR